MSRVTKIGYGVTRTQPGFNNVRVYREIEIDSEDNVGLCEAALMNYVHGVAEDAREIDDLKNDSASLRENIENLKMEREHLCGEIKKLRDVLQQCEGALRNVDVPF